MKTRSPLIVTARIPEEDLEPFDHLRQAHFPRERNFLRAHLTMFHRLPGEYIERVVQILTATAAGQGAFFADVSGLRHLGAGVAFSITSPALEHLRGDLQTGFGQWLGPQDRQKWQPHITIQNRVSKTEADSLYRRLRENFVPHPIRITGLELWRYLDGPWRAERVVPLAADT
ncbi:2'-5' RNA ligase [Neorhizobium huautlense]|uniref:2'-5' RNA ligase n=1 Tax=Neorhizobium huautlense TaxID=67774 RepID=A0ABT9PTR9_9HYPH|nr:2'-5' RNA ligase family protein [Neorhizobium huautlense]MDP9837289.1 2'-5' RNA ligase [Neorhizobium huautlense]